MMGSFFLNVGQKLLYEKAFYPFPFLPPYKGDIIMKCLEMQQLPCNSEVTDRRKSYILREDRKIQSPAFDDTKVPNLRL